LYKIIPIKPDAHTTTVLPQSRLFCLNLLYTVEKVKKVKKKITWANLQLMQDFPCKLVFSIILFARATTNEVYVYVRRCGKH